VVENRRVAVGILMISVILSEISISGLGGHWTYCYFRLPVNAVVEKFASFAARITIILTSEAFSCIS